VELKEGRYREEVQLKSPFLELFPSLSPGDFSKYS